MLNRIISIAVAAVGLFVMTAGAEYIAYFVCGFTLFTAGCIATIGGWHDR